MCTSPFMEWSAGVGTIVRAATLNVKGWESSEREVGGIIREMGVDVLGIQEH